MCKAFQHWLPTELDRAKYNMYIYHPDAMKHQTTDELEEIDDLYIHIYIYIQRVRSYVHVKHEWSSSFHIECEWISQYLEYSSRWKICQLCTMSKGMLKIALNVCCCCSGVFLPASPLNKEWCQKDTWLYYRKRRHNIEFTWTSAFAGRTTVPSRGRSIICIQTDSSIYMFRMAYGTWMYLLMERAKEKLRLGNHGDNVPWNLRLCRQENILDKMIAHIAHFIKSLRS